MSAVLSSTTSPPINNTISANASALQRALFSQATSRDIQKLSPTVVKYLTAGQIGSLSNLQQSYFTGEQLANISVSGWDGTSQSLPTLLTNTQVQSLGKNFILGRSYANLASLLTTQLPLLNATAIGTIQDKNVLRISGVQLNALLGNARNTATHPSELTANAISGITAANIAGISADNIKFISPNAISSLSTTACAALSTGQINALTNTQVARLTSNQLSAMSSSQKLALTGSQLGTLSQEAWGGLTNDLTSISTDKIALLGKNFILGVRSTAVLLSEAQLSVLSVDSVKYFSANQVRSLQIATPGNPLSKLTALLSNARNSATHSSELSAEAVSGILYSVGVNMKYLAPSTIGSLSTQVISQMQPSMATISSGGVVTTLPATTTPYLTIEQAAFITPAQIHALSFSALSTAQRQNIKPDVVANMSESQISALSPSIVKDLTTAQLKALTPQQVHALSSTQLAALTATQQSYMKAGKESGIPTMSTAVVSKLTPYQIRYTLTPQDVNDMSGAQLASLSTNQLHYFSNYQLAAINYSQITELSSPQMTSLLQAYA